jgi:cephalosporin hydroxylase
VYKKDKQLNMSPNAIASRKMGFPIGQSLSEIEGLKYYAWKTSQEFPNSIIIEVGTRNGGSALVLVMNSTLPVITIDVMLDPRHTDDITGKNFGYNPIPPLPKHWARYPRGIFIEQVTCTSWEYQHDGRPVGMVFLDGGHKFEEIYKDWMHFYPLVEMGGYILLHDYQVFLGVTKFVDECIGVAPLSQHGSIVVYQKTRGKNES